MPRIARLTFLLVWLGGTAGALAPQTDSEPFGELSTLELLSRSAEASEALEARLLAVDAAIAAEWAELVAEPAAGIFRLLPPGKHDRHIKVVGGGASYSMDRREHVGGTGAELTWAGGKLKAGAQPLRVGNTTFSMGAGGSMIWKLGSVPLAGLSGDVLPAGLDDDGRGNWDYLLRPPQRGTVFLGTNQGMKPEHRKRGFVATIAPNAAATYLLRTEPTPGAMRVYAFRVPSVGEDGAVVVWRRLAARGQVRSMRASFAGWLPRAVERKVRRPLESFPSELVDAPLESVAERVEALQSAADARVHAIPAEVRERYKGFLAAPGTRAIRLLPAGEFDMALSGLGGASGYSFFAKSHDHTQHPELRYILNTTPRGALEQFQFTGMNTGGIHDLGDFPIEAFLKPDQVAREMRAGEREAWDEFRKQRFRGSSSNRQAAVVLGHTYLLRTSGGNDRDVFIAFRVAQADALGVTLVFTGIER
ncbi:MAG: hypothetical protein GY711_14085 [bacterium]|nr:hypothetical protein [bacterium]